MVPNGSICLSGLKLTRPSREAVSSPSMRATKACAASWKVIAMRTGITQVDATKNVILNPLSSIADRHHDGVRIGAGRGRSLCRHAAVDGQVLRQPSAGSGRRIDSDGIAPGRGPAVIQIETVGDRLRGLRQLALARIGRSAQPAIE